MSKLFACKFNGCDKTFTKASELKKHAVVAHEDLSMLRKCTKCSFETLYPWSLKRHQNRHASKEQPGAAVEKPAAEQTNAAPSGSSNNTGTPLQTENEEDLSICPPDLGPDIDWDNVFYRGTGREGCLCPEMMVDANIEGWERSALDGLRSEMMVDANVQGWNGSILNEQGCFCHEMTGDVHMEEWEKSILDELLI